MGGVSQVPAQMWAGVSPVPAQMCPMRRSSGKAMIRSQLADVDSACIKCRSGGVWLRARHQMALSEKSATTGKRIASKAADETNKMQQRAAALGSRFTWLPQTPARGGDRLVDHEQGLQEVYDAPHRKRSARREAVHWMRICDLRVGDFDEAKCRRRDEPIADLQTSFSREQRTTENGGNRSGQPEPPLQRTKGRLRPLGWFGSCSARPMRTLHLPLLTRGCGYSTSTNSL